MDLSNPNARLHGVLVSVDTIGVLITGESGLGKSECALELLTGGHILIADDLVEVTLLGAKISGKAPELLYGLLEIRGLGIIDVRKLFGPAAVKERHSIDLCVELRQGDPPERIGGLQSEIEICGINVPRFILPTDGRRNLRLLVETAAKLFTSKSGSAENDLIVAHSQLIYA